MSLGVVARAEPGGDAGRRRVSSRCGMQGTTTVELSACAWGERAAKMLISSRAAAGPARPSPPGGQGTRTKRARSRSFAKAVGRANAYSLVSREEAATEDHVEQNGVGAVG